MYDMAKGTHVLMYQRAIEGIGLALETAWNKFNDPKVPEKQKLGYLRLTKDCNEKMFEMTANGPTEMAVLDIMRHADRLGLDYDINKPLMLIEQEQIRNYIRSNPRLDGSHIAAPSDSTTSTPTPKDNSFELSNGNEAKDKSDLNHNTNEYQ